MPKFSKTVIKSLIFIRFSKFFLCYQVKSRRLLNVQHECVHRVLKFNDRFRNLSNFALSPLFWSFLLLKTVIISLFFIKISREFLLSSIKMWTIAWNGLNRRPIARWADIQAYTTQSRCAPVLAKVPKNQNTFFTACYCYIHTCIVGADLLLLIVFDFGDIFVIFDLH